MGDLEYLPRVVAHSPYQGGVETGRLPQAGQAAQGLFQVLGRIGGPERKVAFFQPLQKSLHAGPVVAGELGGHRVSTNFVEFVKGYVDGGGICGRTEVGFDGGPQQAAVVQPDRAAAYADIFEGVEGGTTKLDLGGSTGFADNVDVALRELPEPAPLGPFRPPHRRYPL